MCKACQAQAMQGQPPQESNASSVWGYSAPHAPPHTPTCVLHPQTHLRCLLLHSSAQFACIIRARVSFSSKYSRHFWQQCTTRCVFYLQHSHSCFTVDTSDTSISCAGHVSAVTHVTHVTHVTPISLGIRVILIPSSIGPQPGGATPCLTCATRCIAAHAHAPLPIIATCALSQAVKYTR
jgi:hypothetical protein